MPCCAMGPGMSGLRSIVSQGRSRSDDGEKVIDLGQAGDAMICLGVDPRCHTSFDYIKGGQQGHCQCCSGEDS